MKRTFYLSINDHCLHIVFKLSIAFIILCGNLNFGFAKENKEEISENFSPEIIVDVHSTRNTETGLMESRFIIAVYPKNLIFLKSAEKFVAYYEVELAVMDADEFVLNIEGFRDSVVTEDQEKTLSEDWKKLYEIPMAMPEGDFKASLRVMDLVSSDETVRLIPFQMTNDTKIVSDILIATRETVLTDDGEEISAILPYPLKVFGEANPEMFFQFVLYDVNASVEKPLQYKISYISPKKETHVVNESSIHYPIPQLPVMKVLETSDMQPGDYRLLVEVEIPGEGKMVREEHFSIFQNPANLKFRDFSDVIKEMKFVMPKDVWKKFKTLPESNRQAALDDFWKSMDPTPETVLNEVMTEFYKRLVYAKEHYSFGKGKKQKLTDQGKVYVLFGAPGQIVRNDGDTYSRFLEIWHYPAQDLEVVFEDRVGYGHYLLKEPYSLLAW